MTLEALGLPHVLSGSPDRYNRLRALRVHHWEMMGPASSASGGPINQPQQQAMRSQSSNGQGQVSLGYCSAFR